MDVRPHAGRWKTAGLRVRMKLEIDILNRLKNMDSLALFWYYHITLRNMNF